MRYLRRFALSCAAIGACVSALACGDVAGPDRVPSVGGDWQLTMMMGNAELDVLCQAAGAVSITQLGRNFTGQVSESSESCSGPGGTALGDIDGALLGGQISGSTLSYSDGSCSYSGTVSGTPANRVTGEVTCMVVVETQTYPFTGSWQLLR